MDVLIERCAGLDVHQATVTACVRMSGPGQTRTQVLQTFGTTTPELLALRDPKPHKTNRVFRPFCIRCGIADGTSVALTSSP